MNKLIAICLIAGIGFTACNNNQAKEEALAKQEALQQVKDSLALDSFRRAEAAEKERLQHEQQQAISSSYQDEGQSGYYDGAGDAETQPAAQTTDQKKGWSAAAKGTAIGAAAGAGMGALIDKDKRLRGAAIGAAIGGAGGYVIGRKKDRESGRVQTDN